MTATICPDCHHAPSMRISTQSDYAATCYCKCHDAADAAPDLFEACMEAARVINADIMTDFLMAHGVAAHKEAALTLIVDAIRKSLNDPEWKLGPKQ